jgi:glycosyltransferase involved in cell wall biosynthesis
MRIGLLVYGQLDQISGGYLYDRRLKMAWQKHGHQVDLISLPNQGYLQNLTHNWDRHWRDRLANLELDILVQDELCHPSLFRLNHELQSWTSYPLIAIVHHLRSQEGHTPTWNWLYRWIERRYLSSVNGFIFNSEPTRQSVESMVGHPVSGVIAPPGRDHLNPDLARDEQEDRKANHEVLRLLFVGNIIRRKGLHWLLDSLKSLASNKWHLTIIGRTDLEPGYAQEMLRRAAEPGLESHVITHGPVPQQELARFYQQSDILVVPSSHEGFGLVYLEAMGYGLPVIASRAGGASDLVKPGIHGYLVRPGDTASLSRYLQAYVQDRGLLVEHGQAAIKRFAAHPTWDHSALRALDYLQRAFLSKQVLV